MAKYKAIFHIDENNKWKLTLANVNNLINAIDDDESYEIEVLANAEAVKYYDLSKKLDSDIKTMKKLKSKDVKFVACNNALIANNIEKDNIMNFVNIVPAGVLELVEKQSEGYSYIKP